MKWNAAEVGPSVVEEVLKNFHQAGWATAGLGENLLGLVLADVWSGLNSFSATSKCRLLRGAERGGPVADRLCPKVETSVESQEF